MQIPRKRKRVSFASPPIPDIVVMNPEDRVVSLKKMDVVLLSNKKAMSSGKSTHQSPSRHGFGVPSRTQLHQFLYLRAVECRDQDGDNKKYGQPLHHIGLTLSFPGESEGFKRDKYEFGGPSDTKTAFLYNTKKVFGGCEGTPMLHFPDSEKFVRDWTKVMIYWLTDQREESVDFYEARMTQEHMMAYPGAAPTPHDVMNKSFAHLIPHFTFLAFQNGMQWDVAEKGILILQHFVISMLFPMDWVHLYWACHGFICCLTVSNGEPRFLLVLRALLSQLIVMLAPAHKDRLLFVLTNVYQVFLEKIKQN